MNLSKTDDASEMSRCRVTNDCHKISVIKKIDKICCIMKWYY